VLRSFNLEDDVLIRYTSKKNSETLEMEIIDLLAYGARGLYRAVRITLKDGTHRFFNENSKLEVITNSGKCAFTYIINNKQLEN